MSNINHTITRKMIQMATEELNAKKVHCMLNLFYFFVTIQTNSL